jgi:exoribonuclease R
MNNHYNNNTFEGKVIQKGLFFSIINDNNQPIFDDKVFFVKNFLYSQILPNDIILYTLEENNYVHIIKIRYRKPFQTVAIYTGSNNNKDYFFTPLLTQNFNCFISNHNPENHLTLHHRYIIEIHRDHNTLIVDYGHIDLRINDHKILNDIYTCKWSTHIPTYNLKIQKGTSNNFYTKEYQNLEHLNTFNIDPTNSKDFDDALSFDEVTKKIYVHIVDANQLHLESFIEKRAAYLALTFYNHIQNSNMLPSNLSENAFSLLRGKRRNVITVEFAVDDSVGFNNNNLPILYYDIYPSTIVVKNRYDYDSVLEKATTDNTYRYLKDLCDKYYQRRLNVVQPSYKIDSNSGELQEIYYENMNTWSHTLIEMMMINANRIVTEHMNKVSSYKIPQRIHPEPLSLQVGNLENMITGDELIDSIIMIQKYRTASYNKDDTEGIGHYGLNLEYYTHFTSPIRRYNDVIVMRMINGYIYENLDTLLEHINKRESLNSDFEKIYKRWKLLGYLNKNKEHIYEAYVTNVTKYGIKIYIKSIGFDGFLLNKYLPTLEKYDLGTKINLKCDCVNFTSFEDVRWNVLHH